MVMLRADEQESSMETRDTSPAHLLVKMESFSFLSKNGIQEFESKVFESGGHKWRLIIYPDGDEIGKESDHISAFLSLVETISQSSSVDWRVNAMFNIFLYNHILDNYTCFGGKVCRFYAINTKRGFSKLISKKSFTDASNGYLVGDDCVFGVEVFVIQSQPVIERVSGREFATPFKHEIVISQFSKLEPNEIWKSEEFIALGYRWKIKLYLNGNKSAKGRSMSIYLECVDSTSFAPYEKFEADICFRLKNKKPDKHCTKESSHWFSPYESDWGFADFIAIKDMRDPGKGFVVDDNCYLETEISVKASVDAPK